MFGDFNMVKNIFFQKNVKLLLSDEVAGKNQIHLIQNYKLIKTGLQTANVLNNLFPI